MTYTRLYQIEFNHCDPAGIVFYPRYFEMTNSVVENFFADVVGQSFAKLHLNTGNGVPTVALDAHFIAPSRLGDKVMFSVDVVKVGHASLGLRIEGRMGDETRLRVNVTLVWTEGLKSAPWPADIKARLLGELESTA